MSNKALNVNSKEENSNKKSGLENIGAHNYINYSNIINENSSDNDLENSNLEKEEEKEKEKGEEKEKEKEKEVVPENNNQKEILRYCLEYIKVLSIYNKGKKGQEVDIKEIIDEYKLPKQILEEIQKKDEILEYSDKLDLLSENEIEEEKIDFDNDIQPAPSLNHEMKTIVYLFKPKIIVFDGKLGLFYISPIPFGKEGGYNLIIKNPENMNVIFKLKIWDIISFVKKNEKTINFQNFGTKILTKTNHEMNFKKGEDCNSVYQGITYLINNKEEENYY